MISPVDRLQKRRFKGIVGANIGKQKETPVDRAADDYRYCLERVYPHCDYITVNISSPNTANLRELQDTGPLTELLGELTTLRDRLAVEQNRYRPVLIKIAPDWEDAALKSSLEVIGQSGIDGLIATNTTLARDAVRGHRHAEESGGLSGSPAKQPADRVLKKSRQVLGKAFPIIGLGGITSGADAADKRRLGADLVQIYTGFIYRGPALIGECIRAWADADARA